MNSKGEVSASNMRVFAVALLLVSSTALSSESLVSHLEQRLQANGPEKVNADLATQPSHMAELNQRTADCEPRAVALAVKLTRSNNAKAAERHQESLRIAAGACGEYVLSLLSLKEVPQICASVPSWTATQTARELRRRIKQIEADESLRSSEKGRACSAAYRFELENTRVGIRVGRPAPPTK